MFVDIPAVSATDVNSVGAPAGKSQTLEASAGVQTYSEKQLRQLARIAPIRYCCNPEFYIDEAISEYCPKHVLEENDAYADRIQRAKSAFEPFYPYLRNLIVGTALRKGVQPIGDLSDFWKNFFSNVDLESTSLSSFAKRGFQESLDGGIAGFWVDYPRVDENISATEERSLGLRPYWVIIKCEDILELRDEIFTIPSLNGAPRLGRFPVYLRLRASYEVPSENGYYVVSYPAVREYTLVKDANEFYVSWKLYALLRDSNGRSKDDYEEVDNGILKKSFIPYVPCYGGEVESYNEARPQLLDTARLNLHHWACAADIANVIHNTGFDIKYGTGISKDDVGTIGSDRMLLTDQPDARFGVLASSMNGVDSALANLERIEKSIEKLAAVTVQTAKPQAESGFSKLLDRAQSDSQIAVLVQSLEDALNLLNEYTAEFVPKESAIKVSISRDFIPVKMHSQQVMAVLNLWEKAPISVGLLFRILDAGMVFEGIPEFSVESLLKDLGLTGSETSRELGYGGAGLAAKVQKEAGITIEPGEAAEEVMERNDLAQPA